MHCVSVASGALRWSQLVAPEDQDRDTEVKSAPVVAGRVVLTGADGKSLEVLGLSRWLLGGFPLNHNSESKFEQSLQREEVHDQDGLPQEEELCRVQILFARFSLRQNLGQIHWPMVNLAFFDTRKWLALRCSAQLIHEQTSSEKKGLVLACFVRAELVGWFCLN